MDTLKKTGVGIAIGAVLGITGASLDAPEPTVQFVANPERTIEVLNSIQLTDEQLAKLAPQDISSKDVPVEKPLITDSSLEKYVADSVLEGRPATLGGSLNSWELQTIYTNIAEKNSIIDGEGILNGVDVYSELRK